ncbi:SpoIIE family protein phosphatase [Paractinoplanes globisporus]|uniref:SpoIIE family protein phosphatase n=1 Tax=Paractinoplanes globisporus TaxID=113565 RepID=A0ABW6WUA2_9ACTN|nr:SpoIIE family protein phosphatase [Actinoplanes globisporus]
MSDDRLLSAFDQVPFILVVCEGPDLRVLSLSAATRELLPGRPWQGVPIRDVLSDLIGQQFVDVYYEVYRTGTPATGQEWRAHLDMPDGSVHEMFANFTISPWLSPTGEILGATAVAFDVTELVRQRQAAARAQEKYEESRQVITSLQRELLPTGLPVLPGLQIAASYLLADADTAAGGDWFDAVAQRDGRVALIVGDVVGHGVAASGVMGQLRAVLRDRLDDGAGIIEALGAADRFASRSPGAHATTICMAELDPVSGDLTYCTAGHPPPLVVAPSGETRFLSRTGGSPLATGGSFPIGTARLAPGELLLLYTDGILERPGRDHPAGSAELARVAANCAAGRALREPRSTASERVCSQSVELLVRATGHHDDITLLAAQRVPVVPPLELGLPPEASSLSDARDSIASWLAAVGATDHDTFVLQHALGEVITNAIEHAGTPVAVHGSLTPTGQVVVFVRDHGVWREPEVSPTRGRGLAMAAQLVEGLKVEPSSSGTTARLSHSLFRPGRLLSFAGDSLPALPPSPGGFRIVDEPGGDETRVRIEGVVDIVTAEGVRKELLRRSRGATAAMTVDLSGVTHLSSAGVSVLHQVAGLHTEQKAPLLLLTADGSPVRVILELVGLSTGPRKMSADLSTIAG